MNEENKQPLEEEEQAPEAQAQALSGEGSRQLREGAAPHDGASVPGFSRR